MRALIINGDSAAAETAELTLKSEGWVTETTDLGDEGVDLARRYDYDLVLIGDDATDISGRHVLMRLRANVKTPVIVLSADSSLQAKTAMFREGCDDYVVLPFHRDELVVRATAVARRAKGHGKSDLEIGKVTVHLSEKRATVSGLAVPLTGKEYQMLELLAMRQGSTITKEMFLNHLYGGIDEPEIKIVDVFICKLRRKLRDFGAGAVVETVWGRGYRVERAEGAPA